MLKDKTFGSLDEILVEIEKEEIRKPCGYRTESGRPYGWYSASIRQRRELERALKKKIREVIGEQPPPPCEGCDLRRACADDRLACREFAIHCDKRLADPTALALGKAERQFAERLSGEPGRSPNAWVYHELFAVRCGVGGCENTAVDGLRRWGIKRKGAFYVDACPAHKEPL